MEFNPLTSICADIQREIDELRQREKGLADELQWYSRIDPSALTDDQRRNEATAEQLRLELQEFDNDIQAINAQLDELARAIRTLFNPFNWFAKDQVLLRRRRRELREVYNHKAAQRRSKARKLQATRRRIALVSADLERHRTFDVAGRRRELSQIQQSIVAKTEELAVVADRKRRVDEVLAPLVDKMKKIRKEIRRAEAELEAAEDLDRGLSDAENPYERAKIHEECESEFGEGSPRRVIVERQKTIRKLKRDYDKLKRRAKDVARKAARKIDTIVIDGNNLCYEGGTFIGLGAIESLLPLLSRSYSVLVVFDSAIRKLLSTDDAVIQERLGAHAKVHIVASRRTADETILDLAGASETTYVLSNDRFGDFNEKSAVRSNRIIRHEIVNGNIFVHDLQLRATYR